MMKKLVIILISVFVLFTAVACVGGRRAPAPAGETTTEPVVKMTGDKTRPDRALFEQLSVGMSFEDYWALFKGFAYDFVDTRCIHKYICSDGTEMYVEFKMVFDENNDFDLELKGVFDTCPETPLYNKEDFDRITIGMTEKEVYEILGSRV